MKKITFCFTLLFMTVFGSFGQVQIGDGTFVDKGVPFEPSRTYSYAQSIYLSSEILASGDIHYLNWFYAGLGNLEGSQEITIYLGHTSKSNFSSTSDWEPIANLTEVYSGGISVNGPGWVEISLGTSFTYNGTDNLIVAVKETSAQSDYNEDDFYAFEVTENRSLTLSSYSSVPNLSNPANGGLRKFVPLIILDGINQVCPKPIELIASEPTISGVTLNWTTTASNLQSGAQYYISTTSIAPSHSAEPTGNALNGSSTVTVSELLPATNYYAWVRDVCGDGAGAWSSPVSFTTACIPATELNQTFNSSSTGTLPNCWTSIVYNPQFEPTASIRITNEDGYSGNSVEFARNGETNSMLTLALPPLSNVGAGTHRLSFFAKHASFNSSGTFKIGTLETNDSDSYLSEVGQITTTGNFKEYIIEFSDVDTEHLYIGIQLGSSEDYFLSYIDNIRWEVAPLCPDVTQISIPSLSTSTATISWASNEGSNEWEVVYGTSASADPNTLIPVFSVLNDPTITINELTAETNYYVWVRAKCEAGTGFWVGPVAFKTPCEAVNSINENFDATLGSNLPNCWEKILRGETLSIYASVKTIWDGANSAPKVLELYSGFSNPSTSDEIILVSPNIGNLTAGTHRLKFFAKGEASIEIGTLSSNTPTAVFSPFQIVPISNAEMSEYVVDFSNYDENNSFIGFRLFTTSFFTTVLIDDIVWEPIPSCPDVTNISFVGTTSSSTNVAWASDEAGQWQIVYGAPSVTDPNSLVPSEILTSPEGELTNLSANTTYKVWVRSVCEGTNENGAWSYPVFITTACEAVNTFSENFETAIAPDFPSCWTAINNNDSSIGGVSLITWQPYAGAIGLEIYNGITASSVTPPTLVSPSLGNLGAGTNQLRFFAYYTDTINIEVGTLDADMSVFTPFEQVELTNAYQEYTVDFTSYEGTDSRIGFRLSSIDPFKSVGLDNIIWELAPMCTNVTDVTVVETTTSTADITWTAGSDEIGWQYVYAENTISDPATLTPSSILDAENAQITNLTNGTSYNVWVRSACSETAFGSWVGPITFNTKCLASEVPYTESFETVLTPYLPICSSVSNDVDDVNWTTVNSPGNGFNSKALSYGPNENNVGGAWFFTRGINLTANQNYKISYRFGNNSAGLHESLQVKYGTTETAEGMALEIADHADVTGGSAQINSVTFTVAATGVYYFGFKAYSAVNQWQLFLDDIKVETDLSNNDFDNSNFTFYPNPVKDVLNLSYNQNITSISIFNLLGQKVSENTINSNTAQVNMSGLASGSYIVKVISENQTKAIKVIKE